MILICHVYLYIFLSVYLSIFDLSFSCSETFGLGLFNYNFDLEL